MTGPTPSSWADGASIAPGELLGAWLVRTAGEPLDGRTWELTDPMDRGSRFVESLGGPSVTVVGEPRIGGQAAVARAILSGHGDPVALRVMLASTDPRAQQRERLQVAVGQLSISHQDQLPALVRTLRSLHMTVPAAEFYPSRDGGPQPGSSTVDVWGHVMQWCPSTLADELATTGGTGLGAESAVRQLLPVIRTLQGMHGLGYIHRDLDPSNILVGEDGTLRVADFGIAVHMRADNTHTMTEAWGKPGRMPPEALTGGNTVPVGPAYDAWQVGFVLAEVSTGARPVLPTGDLSPRVGELPEPVQAVVRELLEADRESRLGVGPAADRLTDYLHALELDRARTVQRAVRLRAPETPVVTAEVTAATLPRDVAPVNPWRQAPVGPRQQVPADASRNPNPNQGRTRRRPVLVAAAAGTAVLLLAGGGSAYALLSGDKDGAGGVSGGVATKLSATPSPSATSSARAGAAPAGTPLASTKLATFGRKDSDVRDASLSADGKLLAVSYDADKAIPLWNLTDPAHPARLGTVTLSSGYGWAQSVSVRPDGKQLAASDDNGRVKVYDISDPAHPALSYSIPNYSMYVPKVHYSPNGKLLATTGYDDKVHLWRGDATRASAVSVLSTKTSDLLDAAWSPDGRHLLAQSYEMTTLWDVSTPSAPKKVRNFTKVNASEFADDVTVATSSTATAQTISLWDIRKPATPVRLSTFSTTGVQILRVDARRHRLATSGDGASLGTTPVQMWDITDPSKPTGISPPGWQAATVLLFGPDGRTAVDVGARRVQTWSLTG